MKDYTILKPFNHPLLQLKNRVVMTAMTRNFSDKDHNPTDLMREYYERRAQHEIGFILTEGTIIHPSGDGYPDVPYIYTDTQVKKWREIVDAVHAHGAKIFCQLWHCGRISHSDYLGGGTPVSSSTITAEGLARNKKPFSAPRSLETSEISGIIDMFARAAERVLEANFDGVEIHGGHGYLIDNFFDSHVNKRADQYGGSIENRCRLALEITKRVIDIAGPSRTSLRISPSRELGDILEWPDLDDMLRYLIPELDSIGLRLLDISCARSDYYQTSGKIIRMVRPMWKHIIMGGASLSPEQADEEIVNGFIDLVTYGRFILANPDFIQKIQTGASLVPYDNDMLKTLY